MKHIHETGLSMTAYPVGEGIEKNLPIIEVMGNIIVNEYHRQGINIWCRGSSGAIIAALIASKYIRAGGKARICHVKKEGETSHAYNTAHERGWTNIMVDDFISSGDTVKAIWNRQQIATECEPMDSLLVSSTAGSHVTDFFSDKLRLLFTQ